jgi:acylphosphatase
VSTVRYRLLISGRVQGVFFRESFRRQADERGMAGWVRNLSDGRVEAVLEGPPDQAETLVEWARHGPRQASVDQVSVQTEPPEGLTGFVVR